MGNLREQSWEEIYHGEVADGIRKQVGACPQNCWMVSSAKTAIRSKRSARLPKLEVTRWVAWNKLKVTLGRPIAFDRYIDYGDVKQDTQLVKRPAHFPSNLGKAEKKVLQPAESRRYVQVGEFFNR